MSKKPLELEATLDLTEEGDQCIIELSTSDGRPLTPQIILDAVASLVRPSSSAIALDLAPPIARIATRRVNTSLTTVGSNSLRDGFLTIVVPIERVIEVT